VAVLLGIKVKEEAMVESVAEAVVPVLVVLEVQEEVQQLILDNQLLEEQVRMPAKLLEPVA
jgi:hypothetical protein